MSGKDKDKLQKKTEKAIKDYCISIGCGYKSTPPKIMPSPYSKHDPRFNHIPKRKIKIGHL